MTTNEKQNKVNIQQPQRKLSLKERFKKWLAGDYYVKPTAQEIAESERDMERESRESAQEDSEGDGLLGEGDIIFPEEIQDEEIED